MIPCGFLPYYPARFPLTRLKEEARGVRGDSLWAGGGGRWVREPAREPMMYWHAVRMVQDFFHQHSLGMESRL